MDIETGDSPPIASRPYTLPLKHYDWVRKEITQLERADIITKSISPWASPVVMLPHHRGLEWDDVIPQATSAYNFFPTESSKESPFFLMFGRQPAVKHMLLYSESTKYLGDDEGKLKIEVMRKLYHVIAYNLAKSRAARDGNKHDEENKPEEEQFEPGTNVLVRDHTKKVFHAEYTDHTVVEQVGKNQFVVKDNHGQEKKVHRRDMKEIDSDVKIAELYKELRDEGMRDEKHCMPIKQIPDLGWKAPEAAKATPTGDPDNQLPRSPPSATAKTPPAGDSDNQSTRPPAQTKTTKIPQIEPMCEVLLVAVGRCNTQVRLSLINDHNLSYSQTGPEDV